MTNEQVIKLFDSGHSIQFERECEQLGKRECNIQVDDPGWDGTGYEHPAFYRGQEYGGAQVMRIIKRALDGRNDGNGILGSAELQELRRRILELISIRSKK